MICPHKVFQFIYPIIKSYKINPVDKIIYNSNLHILSNGLTEEAEKNIVSDIMDIIVSINSNILIENINWGIDEERYYAIPYLSKDKPIINSSFSSVILTIFLTLYYYIIIKDYTITNEIVNFIIEKV